MNDKQREDRVKKVGKIGLYVLAFIGLICFFTFGIGGLLFFAVCIATPAIYAWKRTDSNGNKKDGYM